MSVNFKLHVFLVSGSAAFHGGAGEGGLQEHPLPRSTADAAIEGGAAKRLRRQGAWVDAHARGGPG